MANLLKKRRLHPSLLELIFSFPKTIYFNFKVLPFKQALKLPYSVSCHLRIKGVNRKNFVSNFKSVSFGMCRIGISGSETGLLIKNKSLLYIHNGGNVVVNGPISLSRGIYIESNGGTVVFGSDVKMNTGCYIEAEKYNISIGSSCSFGWNCSIKNCDGHFILIDGMKCDNGGDIYIGNHCWVCSEATILKNGYLGNNCVLGYRSVLTKKVSAENNALYIGQPAKIVKRNINWEI